MHEPRRRGRPADPFEWAVPVTELLTQAKLVQHFEARERIGLDGATLLVPALEPAGVPFAQVTGFRCQPMSSAQYARAL